nr:hypothetical protein B0A51_07921 [Rachicladosporium sp. CCFEE 5018]
MTNDLDEVAEAAKAWLGEADKIRWLAIYDNHDKPNIRASKGAAAANVNSFLPDVFQRHMDDYSATFWFKVRDDISIKRSYH